MAAKTRTRRSPRRAAAPRASAEGFPPMKEFPPGGITPVFNEITILLAVAPERPSPEMGLSDVEGPAERLLMQNVIDERTGIVQPTIFIRSDTFADPISGLPTQVLSLAADPALSRSKLLGGELSVHVRAPRSLPEAVKAGFLEFTEERWFAPPVGGVAETPKQVSVGKIQSLSHANPFPARIEIPVYYSFILKSGNGAIWSPSNTRSSPAREPHLMEGIVNSIPPDRDTCLKAREWNLVDESAFLRLWIRVECFRFLGLGDWSHTTRLTYRSKSR